MYGLNVSSGIVARGVESLRVVVDLDTLCAGIHLDMGIKDTNVVDSHLTREPCIVSQDEVLTYLIVCDEAFTAILSVSRSQGTLMRGKITDY